MSRVEKPKSFEEVLALTRDSVKGKVGGILGVVGLLIGCGAREVEDTPKDGTPQERIDDDIKPIVEEYKSRTGCSTPKEVHKKPAWNSDDILGTTSSARDFIWLREDKWPGLTDKQKEALIWHELGHVNGLEHSTDKSDLMHHQGDRDMEDLDMEETKKRLIEAVKGKNSCSVIKR